MSTSVASVVSHFPKPQNGFTTSLASSISSGAATVPLNSVAGYTNGDIAVFVVDPGTASQQAFTGVISTGTVSVTSVVWTAGTNVTHAGGATVVDYATATHIAMMSKGILVSLDQDGTLKAGAVDNAAALASDVVTTAKILDSNVTFAKVATGFSVQMVTSVTSAVATGTTLIPIDDTIPQNTEGDQYMTLAIIPKATTNILVIQAVVSMANSAINQFKIAALFQDATANALAANVVYTSGANDNVIVTICHTMAAGTTSATTFKIRAGCAAAGTTTFNGAGAGRLFGAITKSSLTITEYKA